MTTKIVTPPKHIELWGFIPMMLTLHSEFPLWQQVHEGYTHGGGWNDFDGFEVTQDDDGKYMMQYPGDPAYIERDRIVVGDEMLVLFDYSWVLWVKGDEQKVARID